VASALYAREKTGKGQHIKLAMLDVMIAYLWPEAMMQYTVVGQEASAADPNARPDLIFQTLDGYMTGARSRIRNGRASAAPPSRPAWPRTSASTRRAAAPPTPPSASI
jgi:Predicted acyl-CoA transferases/carnitine dehydratase